MNPEVNSGKLGVYFSSGASSVVCSLTKGDFLIQKGIFSFNERSIRLEDNWDPDSAKEWLSSAKQAWRQQGLDVQPKLKGWQDVGYGLAITPENKRLLVSPKDVEPWEESIRALTRRGYQVDYFEDCRDLGLNVLEQLSSSQKAATSSRHGFAYFLPHFFRNP